MRHKRWKVEERLRLLKQSASLAKSATRTPTTLTHHFAVALWAFTKLEMLEMRTRKSHEALKTHLYLSALEQAFDVPCRLDPVRLDAQLRNMNCKNSTICFRLPQAGILGSE